MRYKDDPVNIDLRLCSLAVPKQEVPYRINVFQ